MMRLRGRWRRYKVILLICSSLLLVLYFLGVDQVLKEVSYSKFTHPLELDSPAEFVETVRAYKHRYRNTYSKSPINTLYSSINFLDNEDHDNFHCSPSSIGWGSGRGGSDADEGYYFLILVKSAPQNIVKRDAIRETWKRQQISITTSTELSLKVLFFIGNRSRDVDADDEDTSSEYINLEEEERYHKDIIRINCIDSYYNNTLKTVMELRYGAEICPHFNYALLIDDDYYLNLKNLYKFTQEQWEVERLYAGFTFFSKPLRHRFFNKWFLDTEEYPFSHFPKYVTAGAILLSRTALMDIYYATFFTEPFRFDDIYVAICAKKMEIEPVHSDHFHFWPVAHRTDESMICAHGIHSEDLKTYWTLQKAAGYE